MPLKTVGLELFLAYREALPLVKRNSVLHKCQHSDLLQMKKQVQRGKMAYPGLGELRGRARGPGLQVTSWKAFDPP